MSWKKLKSKLSEEMDDEFEKFLNESLSDESLGSPRRSITPRGARSKAKILSSQSKNKFEKPWWATSEDDEDKSGFSDVVKKSWLKKKEKEEETAVEKEEVVLKSSTNLISKDSLEVTASRPGTALDTILSEPEYSVGFEGSDKDNSKGSENISRQSKRSNHVDYSSDSQLSDNGDDIDDSKLSSIGTVKKNSSTTDVDIGTMGATYTPGMDTLDEMRDKEAFFKHIEKEANRTVDYAELNKEFDGHDNVDEENKDEGMEIGLQLYKQHYSSDESSEGSDNEESYKSYQSDEQISKKSDISKSNENSSHSLHSSKNESHSNNSLLDDRSQSTKSESRIVHGSPSIKSESRIVNGNDHSDINESSKINQAKVVDKGIERLQASSMLSKVSLMESLESTYGMNLTAKLSKLKKYDKADLRDNMKEQEVEKIDDTTTEQTTGDEHRFDTGRTTADLAHVLQNVNNLATQSLDPYTVHTKSKSNADEAAQLITDLSSSIQPPVQSSMLVLDQQQQHELPVNQFNLQPVISNLNDEPKVPALSSIYKKDYKIYEESPQERYKIIQDEINNTIKDEVEKVLKENISHPKNNLKTHPVNTKAYDLSPILDSQGFDLQPIDDTHGFDLQPIETMLNESSDDSLQQTKGNSFNIRGDPPNKKSKTLTIRSKTNLQKNKVVPRIESSQEKSKNIKKKFKSPSKSTPNIKSSPSYQRATANSVKKSSIPKYKPNNNKSTHQQSQTNTSIVRKKSSPIKRSPLKSEHLLSAPSHDTQQQLITSMDNMTSYLKEITNQQQASNMISKSFTIHRDDHIESLNREHSLQTEVQQLRLLFEDERRQNDKLKSDLQVKDKKWELKHEELMRNHENNIKDLKDEVQVLKKKLEMEEEQNDENVISIKKKDKNGKIDGEFLNEEELNKLQTQLEQQEILLNGYQQENQRLYNQIKKHETEKKKYESNLLKENQKLATEIANFKEQQELHATTTTGGSASLGANKISQLTNQVKFYQSREREYKEEILNFENEVSSLKRIISVNEKQKVYVDEKGLHKELEKLKYQHSVEIDKLTKRLKWYGENQQLIDKDTLELTDKRNELNKLRDLIGRLEEENKKLKYSEKDKKTEKNNDNKKILDLQRQVKEMEDIIKRRYPNSIPAMIYAASSVPNEMKTYEPKQDGKNQPIAVFLEKRVKILEEELENKDIDNSKKVRSIEQNYNSMSLRYEEHIKQLEMKIKELTLKLKTAKSTEELEIELANSILKFQDIIESLKTDLESKQAEITSLKLQVLDLEAPESNARHKASKTSSKSSVALNNDISKLRDRIRNKDSELLELKTTITLLQKDREKLLNKINQTSTKNMENLASTTTRLKDQSKNAPQTKLPTHNAVESKEENIDDVMMMSSLRHIHSELNEKYIKLLNHNKHLQVTIQELQLEVEEKRLKVEAINANALSDERKLRESFEEQIKLMKDSYEKKLEKQKLDYIVEHSNSKVAELNGKLRSYEILQEHMKGVIEEAKQDRKKLEQAKESEVNLRSKIKDLENEIHESRSLQTPEAYHYKTLQSKILSIENRHTEKERQLQNIINRVKYKASIDIDQLEDKWRDMLRHKDQEIQHFRTEMDSILEVLKELQRQGVVLPNHDNEYL